VGLQRQFREDLLSRFLGLPTGEYLDPVQWRCSMVWAATMGLPLSLEGVGAVLGLGKQKLTEGKDLIKYFCQPCAPTKANGGAPAIIRITRRTSGQPSKNITCVMWKRKCPYRRLASFPCRKSVWDEYHLDQEINDRGVALDMALVQEAIHGRPLPL
jgi:DNA polymerase